MKNTILAALAALKQRVLDFFTHSASDLIAAISAMEAKIERTIDMEVRKLTDLSNAKKAIDAAITDKNASLDAAYKLLHKVTEITK